MRSTSSSLTFTSGDDLARLGVGLWQHGSHDDSQGEDKQLFRRPRVGIGRVQWAPNSDGWW
jgi:hypothetical protein